MMQPEISPTINERPSNGHIQPLNSPTSLDRRVSPRLWSIPDCKKPFYGSCGRKKPLEALRDNASKKKVKVDSSTQICQVNRAREFVEDEGCSRDVSMSPMPVENGEEDIVISEVDFLKWICPGNSLVDKLGKGTFLEAKEMLRLFNLHHLRTAQEEEEKRVEISDLQIVKGSKPKMSRKTEVFYPDKKFGRVPGVEVGHQFSSRAEMAAVGFDGHWLNGIDYTGKYHCKLEEYHGYTFPLTVAIMLSGQYEDDVDDSEEVVYTGQGGIELLSSKPQVKNQVMLLGNLALKHNMDYCVPVKVIRGHACADSYTGKVYKYDGLYKVVNCRADKDVSGFTVFKYRLKRLQEESKLASKNQVCFMNGQVSKDPSEAPGLVCVDISSGQEDICIPATNVIDNPPVAPSGFTYIKSIQVAKDVFVPSNSRGCKCKGSCNDSKNCYCYRLNGCDFPYVRQDGGRLTEPRDVVFECGPNCGCGPGCVNRISQRGLKYQLEVYRTEDKGWAVRSWDFIPSGAPVCEYTGVLRRSDELDNVSQNDFIFEIDCWQTMNEIEGREKRQCNVSAPAQKLMEETNDKVSESAPEFCIDAGSYGNVARFINHSCEPNLFVQCVLSSHHDIRLARVVLFAADGIPPMQELTYDYGYALDSVIGPDGEIKKMACNCGTADCRKRLF